MPDTFEAHGHGSISPVDIRKSVDLQYDKKLRLADLLVQNRDDLVILRDPRILQEVLDHNLHLLAEKI